MDSRNLMLDVELDMPETLPVISEELALIETFMRDIVNEITKIKSENS